MYFKFHSQPGGSVPTLSPVKRTQIIPVLFRNDSGKPFTFDGRSYWFDLYDQPSPYEVIMAARQSEKSSHNAKMMLVDAVTRPEASILYAAPTHDHITEFRSRKIDRPFHYNPSLRRQFLGSKQTNNATEKVLSNGASMVFRAIANNPDSVRGISADRIYFDETQLIPSDHIQVAVECAQSFGGKASFCFTGTPTHTRDALVRRFRKTKMYEWLIKCLHCPKYNPPLGWDHIDQAKPYLFCVFCGKELEVPRGEWVATRPDAKLDGYRICRLMTPTCTWHTKANNGVLDHEKTLPAHLFANEVLGLPFDLGSKPITEEELYACCEDNPMMDPLNLSDYEKQRYLVGAIDWAYNDEKQGSSFTILALAGINHQKRVQIVFVRRYFGPEFHDPQAVLEDITRICNTCNVEIIATDRGVGHKENYRLRELLPKTRVVEVQYVGADMPLTLDKVNRCFKVGKTNILNETFNRLKDRGYMFPRKADIEPFAEDILNVTTELDKNFRRVTYKRLGFEPDDFLDLCAFLGILIERKFNIKIREPVDS